MMSLLSLIPQTPPEFLPRQPEPEPESVGLTFTEVGHGYRPGRGLVYSVIAHEIAFFILFFGSFSYSYIHRASPAELTQVIDLSNPKQVIYLPLLGGGSEGDGHPGGAPGIARKAPSAAPASNSKGLSYPGPQPIVSDPPNPTNRLQTVLQPALEYPPILQKFAPLPNMVQMTDAGPRPLDVRANKATPVFHPTPMKPLEPPKLKLRASALPELMPSQPDMPVFQPAPTTPIEPPKLALPVNAPPPLVVRKSPKRVADKRDKPIEPPRPEQISPVPTRGTDLQNLVALSPMPAPPGQPVKVPAGEARGRFAISPDANAASAQPRPGSKMGGLPSAAVGIGAESSASGGNAAAIAGGAGNGGEGSSVGGSGGVGTGTGSGKGSGNGGSGTGAGRGSGVGPGMGEGAGHSSGSGTGAGAGHGGGAFAGITIQGSGSGSGAAGKSTWHVAPQTAYGMTVVATASSGGGLPDFGVFADEKVYTVYLDMSSADDPAPALTLQYALLRDPSADSGASRSAEGLMPPFPVVKDMPQFPVELVQKYLRRLIVVYAIMDTRGKLQQMLVMQSPDDRLTSRILAALNKWVFRPAELKGQPVSVKVLLGFPLSLPE